jgi:hypothetical protein
MFALAGLDCNYCRMSHARDDMFRTVCQFYLSVVQRKIVVKAVTTGVPIVRCAYFAYDKNLLHNIIFTVRSLSDY